MPTLHVVLALAPLLIRATTTYQRDHVSRPLSPSLALCFRAAGRCFHWELLHRRRKRPYAGTGGRNLTDFYSEANVPVDSNKRRHDTAHVNNHVSLVSVQN